MAGEAMLASVAGERRTLGGLAAAIWMILDEPRTVEEVASELHYFSDGVAQDPDPAVIEEALALMDDHGAAMRCRC